MSSSEISDAEVLERFPDEWIDRDNVHFFRGLLQRRLLVKHCTACGTWFQPPWPTCPACWSNDVDIAEVGGEGIVHTFTAPPGSEPSTVGVCLAVVELAESPGLRATGTIVDCALDEVQIGMPVTLTWIERDGCPRPAFARA